MPILIETFFGRTERDKMSVFGRRDNLHLLGIFTLITGLCCLTGIDSKVVRMDTKLDPDGAGVCNKTKLVEKDVMTTVSYVTSRKTKYKKCDWTGWWCSTKTKAVYRTAYRMETRPTMSPVQVLSCCEGYIRKDSFCVPDCMKSDCTKNCTDCSTDHSYCNHVTGVCHCKPGYYHHGNGCQACSSGWYGQNCTLKCQCQGNLSICDPQSGACSCEPGKAGPTCDDTCEPERWGEGCDRYCNCSSYPCDSGTGLCVCGAGRTGTRCENAAAVSNASGTDQHTNTNNTGSDVIIPVVSVLGVLIIAMVIIGVVFYRKRRMVKRDETSVNGTERVNAAYSPDGLPHAVLPSSGIISNCDMRENDIYAPGGADMVEYDKLNFQGHFKKLGQGHQRQNIYSNPQMESDSSGMVENELYSMD